MKILQLLKNQSHNKEIFRYIWQQPSRGVLRKRCSENMQQIYRRRPMPKSDFIEITLRHGCSPINLLHISRTTFLKNSSGWLLLHRALTPIKPSLNPITLLIHYTISVFLQIKTKRTNFIHWLTKGIQSPARQSRGHTKNF